MENGPLSEIQQFYDGSIVFITGATGLLGQLLLEKLLRSCPGIKAIYVLVRSKNISSKERLEKMFKACIFDPIKRTCKQVLEKVHVVCGDLTLPNLGVSAEDWETLRREVNVIFHVAASIRFDEPLKVAAYSNVRATWDLIKLAHEIKNFRVFVYVSTAYSFPHKSHIDEVRYELKMTAEDLLSLVQTVDDESLESITPSVLGEWPNTYTFTKGIAEEVVHSKAQGLRYAIVRPAIVTPTAKEPLAGWTNNLGGIAGLHFGVELGLLHVFCANSTALIEIVPADYVVNSIVAVAWYSDVNGVNSIYNYVSSVQNPMHFDAADKIVTPHISEIPTVHRFWHKFVIVNSNKYLTTALHYLLHVLVVHIADLLLVLRGKKPFIVKKFKQAYGLLEAHSYFIQGIWTFTNDNTQLVYKSMSVKDRELFNFDMGSLDWNEYGAHYARGLRVYLLKDPLETVPKAKKRAFKLKIAHYTTLSIILIIIFLLFNFVIKMLI